MNQSTICKKCGKIFKGVICPKCGEYNENEEIPQDFLDKNEKRHEINDKYGFTDDEIIRIYHTEARQADKVYRSFVTDGVSRVDKVNGRFLASQLIKLDILSQQNNRIIQQNDEIIDLLKKIAEKQNV